MTAVAFGARGSNPAQQHSFIITEELAAPTVSLEDYSINWCTAARAARLKWALIAVFAQMVGAMHRAGVNHRDCYISFFVAHRSAYQCRLISIVSD